MNQTASTLLYEGKAKQVWTTKHPDQVLIVYKNSATAFNAQKKAEFEGKGALNGQISGALLTYLTQKGIPNHLIAALSNHEMLCKRVDIIPAEMIARNKAAGSFAQRMGVPTGTALLNPVYELCYKSDELQDPFITLEGLTALGLATYEQLQNAHALTQSINQHLTELFSNLGLELIDFKLEFGVDREGQVILADEISQDTCRLWDKQTGQSLDKDLFRQDSGDLIAAYKLLWHKLSHHLEAL